MKSKMIILAILVVMKVLVIDDQKGHPVLAYLFSVADPRRNVGTFEACCGASALTGSTLIKQLAIMLVSAETYF